MRNNHPHDPYGAISLTARLCSGCGQPRNKELEYCAVCDQSLYDDKRFFRGRLRLGLLLGTQFLSLGAVLILAGTVLAPSTMAFVIPTLHVLIATLASFVASFFITKADSSTLAFIRRRGFLFASLAWLTRLVCFVSVYSSNLPPAGLVLVSSLLTLSQISHLLALSPKPR